jgi:transcriptional regulator with XRE-family HTH domain
VTSKAKSRKAQRKRPETAESKARVKAGEVILAAIKKAGFTIRSFARSIGVEPSTVSRWCAGKRFPGRQKLALLRDKLGVDPAKLV